MDRDTVHSKPPFPPSLPSPGSSAKSSSFEKDDHPTSSLSLPMLAPRAPKHCSRKDGGETSASLLDFVNLMSLTDVARARTSSVERNSFLLVPASSSAPELQEEDTTTATTTSTEERQEDETEEEMDGSAVRRASLNHAPPHCASQWSLTTPEPTKVTISTPRGFRISTCHKRKSPQIHHSTPVDGNRPLMLPSLSSATNSSNAFATAYHNNNRCHHHHLGQQHQRSAKKAKNYKTLLSNAPMLPSSPDLEDRVMAAHTTRYHPPCFSPPVGGITLVNPNFRRLACTSVSAAAAASVASPPLLPLPPSSSSPPAGRVTIVPGAAAGLPTLDDDDEDDEESEQQHKHQPPQKWLRMKKRTSLLNALRLGAGQESS